MNLGFDFDKVRVTEFGVGQEGDGGQTFVAVPVDIEVQAALREMAQASWNAMVKASSTPERYEPSEKHANTEHLYLPLADELSAPLRQLHEVPNLDIDTAALDDPTDLFCYFARLRDKQGRRLTALRRANQFKGVLKSRNRLVRMLDDTLKMIEDSVFKLDYDFDLLIAGSNIHILRPSGFEFAGKLQQAILEAVPDNIKKLQQDLSFVAFDGVETYAKTHPRAARYLASIRSQEETKSIDKTLLKKACKATGVEVAESKGQVMIAVGHEMGFLEVLDRRRYQMSLVPNKTEKYRAASRQLIND